MGVTVPPVIPEPFANAAVTGGSPGNKTAPIPDTVTDSALASWRAGFQAITMQPVAAGGKPPKGQDINGVLFALSSHDYYVQAGQLFPYQSAVATAISGYGLGTILGSADGSTVWFNTSAGNLTNPDDPSTSAGWVSLYAYGFLTLNSLTGGAVTINKHDAGKRYIVLNGALAGNLTIVVPDNLIGSKWLVINNTSGSSFTTTVKTAAGTGVVIPQGGFSNPVEVYSDGANVFPTVAPLGVPISQTATPLTLAERDNTGQLIAAYFFGTSAFENPAAQPVNGLIALGPDQATLRKYHTLDIQAAMALGSFAGQVTAGQVPLSAVLQYVANILANANLTGIPVAPTPPVNTNNAQLSTTAFANPWSLVGIPGGFMHPSGIFVQFGTCNPAGGTVSVTLPRPYTNAGTYVVLASSTGRPTQCNPQITDSQHITVSNTGGSSFWITIGF